MLIKHKGRAKESTNKFSDLVGRDQMAHVIGKQKGGWRSHGKERIHEENLLTYMVSENAVVIPRILHSDFLK